jgi:hypothetical protein
VTLIYYYLVPASLFHDALQPAFTQSFLWRDLAPCRPLCQRLLWGEPALPADCLVRQVCAGLPFSRHTWHALVGECLLFGSIDLPRLPATLEALTCLLAPGHAAACDLPRPCFAPIQQVHLGSRDLHFGGYYRPEHAGYNDRRDVARLLDYLAAQDPEQWCAPMLVPLPGLTSAEERGDELAFVREWWPALVQLYERAAHEELLIVCEEM